MKMKSASWFISAIALGFLVAANGAGCSDPAVEDGGGSGGEAGKGGAGGTGGTGGTGGGTGGGPVDLGDWLGLPCSADAECGKSGMCVKSDAADPVFGGGPSNGYCSMKCQASGDCPGVANICYKPTANAAEGRCVLGCEIGPELMSVADPLDEFKCHGREDVACFRINAGDVCLPTCGNDSECPSGKYCDLAAGACLDAGAAAPPLKLGSSCVPMGPADQCGNGFCIGGLPNGQGFCTGLCTLGGELNYGDCGGLDKGICAFSRVVEGCPPDQSCVGAGDFGICTGGCEQHDQCAAPGLWCNKIMGFPTGYCFGVKECPNGNECMANDGVCTETKVGKWCLDPTVPLGTLAPDMGSGGAGGAGGMGGGGMGGGGMGGGGMGGGGMGGGGMGGSGGT